MPLFMFLPVFLSLLFFSWFGRQNYLWRLLLIFSSHLVSCCCFPFHLVFLVMRNDWHECRPHHRQEEEQIQMKRRHRWRDEEMMRQRERQGIRRRRIHRINSWSHFISCRHFSLKMFLPVFLPIFREKSIKEKIRVSVTIKRKGRDIIQELFRVKKRKKKWEEETRCEWRLKAFICSHVMSITSDWLPNTTSPSSSLSLFLSLVSFFHVLFVLTLYLYCTLSSSYKYITGCM